MMNSNPLYEPYIEKLNSLFPQNEQFSFLVGAGISIEPPTNLPSARVIASLLLKHIVPKTELETIENLNALEALRYETIIELIEDIFDGSLTFMNYFELDFSPNLIHYFLAHAISQQHYILTTNFDYMIEKALVNILPPNKRSNIVPVITREDFEEYQNPQRIFNENKYPLYKIHGSKQNIITKEPTIHSLITTISSLGRGREQGETFAIETYKKPAVRNLTENRSLIIMGYSGNDDFDINPTLMELPNLKRIIWIEHAQKDELTVLEKKDILNTIEKNDVSLVPNILKTLALSADYDLFLIKTHTAQFIEQVLSSKILKKSIEFDLESPPSIPSFEDWVSPIVSNFSEVLKYLCAAQIYYNLSQFELFRQCAEKGLVLVKEIPESRTRKVNQLLFSNLLGLHYEKQHELEKALDYYNSSLEIINSWIDQQRGDRMAIPYDDAYYRGFILNNLGIIYLQKDELEMAMFYFLNARSDIAVTLAKFENYDYYKYSESPSGSGLDSQILKMFPRSPFRGISRAGGKSSWFGGQHSRGIIDWNSNTLMAAITSNLGQVYFRSGELDKALTCFNEALQINIKFGNLQGKAFQLTNIAKVLYEKKNYKSALEYLQESLKIFNELGLKSATEEVDNFIEEIRKKI
ncbi:MAG: tetratricopeptide repeat protein [Promethearchaeota archaeon]